MTGGGATEPVGLGDAGSAAVGAEGAAGIAAASATSCCSIFLRWPIFVKPSLLSASERSDRGPRARDKRVSRSAPAVERSARVSASMDRRLAGASLRSLPAARLQCVEAFVVCCDSLRTQLLFCVGDLSLSHDTQQRDDERAPVHTLSHSCFGCAFYRNSSFCYDVKISARNRGRGADLSPI